MHLSEYGPFANVVAIAGFLVATFGILLLKALGRMNRWTWLAGSDQAPGFLVAGGARILAVALMAMTYVTIDAKNYLWFGGSAIIFGIIGFYMVARFDKLRKLYVLQVPLVGPGGSPLLNKKGKPTFASVVIATEDKMRDQAKQALAAARQKSGGVSIGQFMSGYGATKVNDPEALWDRPVLVENSTKLTRTLMYLTLCGVMALFVASFAIDVYMRKAK